MEFVAPVFFFVLGSIIGSFLNVVILRFNTGVSLGGRSRCFSCGKGISWYDMVPIASYLALQGKCRLCRSHVSIQYPAVETLTGLLFLGVFLVYGGGPVSAPMILDMALMAILVVIGVYDLLHKIIPDRMAFLFGLLALCRMFIFAPISSLIHLPGSLNLLAGPILAVPIYLLWRISGGRLIGLGDAKLAFGIGWFLGLMYGISAMILGFWIGAIVGVSLVVFSKLTSSTFGKKFLLNMGVKSFTMKSEIPLAPFLIAGCFLVYFFRINAMGIGFFIQSLYM